MPASTIGMKCKIPNISSKLLGRSMGNPSEPKNILYFYVRQLVDKSQTRLALQNPCTSALFTYCDSSQAANKLFKHGIIELLLPEISGN